MPVLVSAIGIPDPQLGHRVSNSGHVADGLCPPRVVPAEVPCAHPELATPHCILTVSYKTGAQTMVIEQRLAPIAFSSKAQAL